MKNHTWTRSVLALAALVVAPSVASATHDNIDGATIGRPGQSGYQPLTYAELIGQGFSPRSDPTGSTYAGGPLVQDGINAFFLNSGPNIHVWSSSVKSTGNNGLTGAAMSTAEFYLPGAGPNGGDIIQVNVFTDNRSAWVPPGVTSPNGVPFNSWRLDVGIAAHNDPIEFSPAPRTVLTSGHAWFNAAGGSYGTFNLGQQTPGIGNSGSAVGGLGVIGLGGADIAGFDLAEGAIFFELDAGVPPGHPADDCSSPELIAGQGLFPFDLTGATTGTEGQNEGICVFFGQIAIANDIWYEWTADVTGTATVSTCGLTSVDTKIAAYAGAGCPADGTAIACNDDTSGCGLQSVISFPVTAGGVYMIQLGTWHTASPGPGSMDISIVPSTPPIFAFCFGDGSGAPCPCPAFPGGPGEGCANATGSGSALSWTGSESVSANDLVLIANNLPGGSNTFGVFFQGTVLENGGLGTPFGDGLLCSNTSIVRLELAPNVGGTATSTTSISGGGGVAPGTTAYYQFWYRAVAGPCGFGFNTSSAVGVNWGS